MMTSRPALIRLTSAIVVAAAIACGDSSRNSQTAATAESTQTGAPTESGPAETRPPHASTPAPAFREIVIPAGTVLKVRLESTLASARTLLQPRAGYGPAAAAELRWQAVQVSIVKTA